MAIQPSQTLAMCAASSDLQELDSAEPPCRCRGAVGTGTKQSVVTAVSRIHGAVD